MEKQLEEFIQSCTVKLSIDGAGGWGTGFFVAPGLILTCAHVVKSPNVQPIKVCWRGQTDFATAIVGRDHFSDPYDIALLRFNSVVSSLPVAPLDRDIRVNDSIYTYGYSDEKGFSDGYPVTGLCEGIAGIDPPLIKFKAGQIRPGLSGSPLVNQRTGKVCGVVRKTRDRNFDLGGLATPVQVIFSQWTDLEDLNRQKPLTFIVNKLQHYIREVDKIIRDSDFDSLSVIKNRVTQWKEEVTDFLSESVGEKEAYDLATIFAPTPTPRGSKDPKARSLSEARKCREYLVRLLNRLQ